MITERLLLITMLCVASGAVRGQEANPAAQQQQQMTQNAAIAAYNRNVNPNATVHSTGIYDQEDLYRGADGNPLPGAIETPRTASDQSQWVAAPGFSPKPKTRYQWQVRVWDGVAMTQR